jgi:dTDP-4-dehydrorhamnose 3,5-epimerase
MRVTELPLPGVKLMEPDYFEDYRGYYAETYSARTLRRDFGIDVVFVQDNHSMNYQKGILRGIHFQNNPHPQVKLVRCVSGALLDVAVDLRRGSPTFKKWLSVVLSAENRKQLLIPGGFGHAYLCLTDNTQMLYKTSDFYEPALDRAIKYNDPDIGVNWPFPNPVISQKDIGAPGLADSDVNFTMEANP